MKFTAYKNWLNEEAGKLLIKYTTWPWGGYSEGYPAWVLYKGDEPIVAISNDTKDKNNVVIRHIESKEKGRAAKFIMNLLDAGVTISTGKANYNSISTTAYYMNKKVIKLIDAKPDKYGYKILGKADNRGKEDDEAHIEIKGKPDINHYKFFKK